MNMCNKDLSLLPVKAQLLNEPSTLYRTACLLNGKDDRPIPMREIGVLPITHNTDWVELLFWGWSIKLYADGTWRHIQDTSGG